MAPKASTPTAPAADTQAPAAALTFEDATVPAVTREPKANPFAPIVKALADNRESAKAFTVPAADVAANVRLAQLAGKPVGVTVRNRQEKQENGSVKVTIWAVDRISRPRKDK